MILFGIKIWKENLRDIMSKKRKAVTVLGAGSSLLIGMGTLSPDFIFSSLSLSNFIGIVFARSLHYQFYVWYFFSLPHLLYMTNLPLCIKLFLLLTIEISFNTYPSTSLSSFLLQAAHIVLLTALYLAPAPLALSLSLSSSFSSSSLYTSKDNKKL